MLATFTLAMLSTDRQSAFRRAVVLHILVLLVGMMLMVAGGPAAAFILGHLLLITGIVEGAVLIGWRLSQMPKSQALEFLLVTPLRPRNVFLGEALAGLGRLALVTLTGLPVILLLTMVGPAPGSTAAGGTYLEPGDVAPLLIMPFTWGALTGLGLTTWAYESLLVRRWGERIMLALIVIYLVVGVLAVDWLRPLKEWVRRIQGGTQDLDLLTSIRYYPSLVVLTGIEGFHQYNPFAVLHFWLQDPYGHIAGEQGMVGLELGALAVILVLLFRASGRLRAHFHERHYRPILDPGSNSRGTIGERPLSWWAVRRVTEYSGRVNLWIAGGFGLVYAAYILVGKDNWPFGRTVFQMVEQAGGIPTLTTGLVVLAAVPASFQYGLWDSNAQDRCRRLELLLVTELEANDYWHAALAAAWRRGRGYFLTAVMLWSAAVVAGQITLPQMAAALLASMVLWFLYFTLGFRAFSRGIQANGLGSFLTLGLPSLTFVLYLTGWGDLATLLPPGSVYSAAAQPLTFWWLMGPVGWGLFTLLLTRFSLGRCDAELRHWYELHHGRKVLD